MIGVAIVAVRPHAARIAPNEKGRCAGQQVDERSNSIAFRKQPPYSGGFLAVRGMLSNRSCWFASVRHAISIRLKVDFVSSSSERSARKAQSSALSRKISANFMPARWTGNGWFQPDHRVKCL
jgi:hypothetical protein